MSELLSSVSPLPDISKPRLDQTTYYGRAMHFYETIHPMNLFATSKQLHESKIIVNNYKSGNIDLNMTVDELWKWKQLYDSAYHPESGKEMFILGRMSAQAPVNMIISGGMLTFYKSFRGVVAWHFINQSFNAIVNYTNRSGPNAASDERLAVSFACATGGACTVALGLNSLVKNASGLAGRLVPFVAIALANAINIPMMRSLELEHGIEVRTEKGESIVNSRRVAAVAIAQVVLSRISMALPYMTLTPIIMNQISKTKFYQGRKWLAMPIQVILAGIGVLFTTPLCCAFFPQTGSIKVKYLEPEVREVISRWKEPLTVVYYNKGL